MKKFVIFWAALLLVLFAMLLWPEQASGAENEKNAVYKNVPAKWAQMFKKGMCLTKKNGSFGCVMQIDQTYGAIWLGGMTLVNGRVVYYTAHGDIRSMQPYVDNCLVVMTEGMNDNKERVPKKKVACDKTQLHRVSVVADAFAADVQEYGLRRMECVGNCRAVFYGGVE